MNLWELDVAVKPVVTINRAAACDKNVIQKGDHSMFDPTTNQRLDAFSDVQLSVNRCNCITPLFSFLIS